MGRPHQNLRSDERKDEADGSFLGVRAAGFACGGCGMRMLHLEHTEDRLRVGKTPPLAQRFLADGERLWRPEVQQSLVAAAPTSLFPSPGTRRRTVSPHGPAGNQLSRAVRRALRPIKRVPIPRVTRNQVSAAAERATRAVGIGRCCTPERETHACSCTSPISMQTGVTEGGGSASNRSFAARAASSARR